jgi:hypothetical protein
MQQFDRTVKVIKKIRPVKWLSFFVHLSVWLMLFLAFSLFSIRQNQSLPLFIVLQYFYGFVLFYLNYFFLSPRYLLPKKYISFTVSILFVILISFFVVDPFVHQLSFHEFIRNAPLGFGQLPPDPQFPHEMLRDEKLLVFRRSIGTLFLLFAFLTFSSSIRIFQKLMSEEDLS